MNRKTSERGLLLSQKEGSDSFTVQQVHEVNAS